MWQLPRKSGDCETELHRCLSCCHCLQKVHYAASHSPSSCDLSMTEVVFVATFVAKNAAVEALLWISEIETPKVNYSAGCPYFRGYGVLTGRNVNFKSVGLKVVRDSMILCCVADFNEKCALDCSFFKTQNLRLCYSTAE